jgi:hypothetical protein
VTYAGNVGIGTTTPITKLQITDSSSNGSLVTYLQNTGSTVGGLRTYVGPDAELSVISQGVNITSNLQPLNALSTFTGTTDHAGRAGTFISMGGGKFALQTVGAGSGQTSTARLSVDVNGNVGVNTTTQTSTFLVQGIAGPSNPFTIASSTGASLVTVTPVGNVGIGTSNPTAKLVIGSTAVAAQNTIKIYGDITSNNAPLVSLFRSGAAEGMIGLDGSSRMVIANTNGLANYNDATLDAAGSYAILLNPSGTGNVGIGTTGPSQKLEVNGASQFDNLLYLGSTGYLTWDGGVTNALNLLGASGKSLSLGSNGVYDRLFMNTSGNVGIATTSPIYKLQVAGTANFGGGPFVVAGGTSASTFFDDGSGGTAYNYAPNFMIRSDSSGTTLQNTNAAAAIYNQNGGTNTWVKLALSSNETTSTSSNPVTLGGIAAQMTSGTAGSWAKGDVVLWTKNLANTVEVLRATSGGNVGIGTSSPTATLFVQGATSSPTANVFTTASSSGAGMFIVNASGNVGIGSTTPSYSLDVNNGANGTYPLRLLSAGKSVQIGALNSSYAHFQTDATSGFWFYQSIRAGAANNVANNLLNTPSADSYIAGYGGNVGIGTTSASASLFVQGTSSLPTSNVLTVASSTGTALMVVNASGNVGIGTTTPAKTLQVYSSSGTAIRLTDSSINSLGIELYPTTGAAAHGFSIYDANASATRLTINSSGNVGISTTTPGGKLQINGTAAADALGAPIVRLDAGITHELDMGSLNAGSFGWYLQGVTNNHSSTYYPILLNPSGGNVGVGTTAPQSQLHIYAASNSSIKVDSTSNSWTEYDVNNGSRMKVGSVGGLAVIDNTYNANYLAFRTNGTTQMVMDTNGNFGIGTISPQSLLHVEGASATANIIATTGTPFLRLANSPAASNRKEIYIAYDTTNNYSYLQSIQQGVAATSFVLQPKMNRIYYVY